MKATANENDINDILQTFNNSCYHHQCIANWTASCCKFVWSVRRKALWQILKQNKP